MTGLGDQEALAVVVDSGRIDVAQIYYNALNPSAIEEVSAGWNTTNFAGLAKRCATQDMGIMGIRIFAAGHLATDVRHGREIPITANADDRAEEARAQVVASVLGDAHGTRAQAALRFGLASDLLSTIVVGIGETEHFDQVLGAIEMGPLDAGARAAISELWRNDHRFIGSV
jgi:L-galactose dehydrogenase/L-glyceraldehyde 3-phosphate reductase